MSESNDTTQATGDGGDCLKRVVRLELPLVKVRKPHRCRLCGEEINVGESVYSWSSLASGEGWKSTHVHPECYAETKEWDSGDWECSAPGDMDRPKNITLIA